MSSAELLTFYQSYIVFVIVLGTASVNAVDPATTDEFKLGDCVWVSGVKKGVIAFIGETQFAPGVWAGVQLDEPIGKNDGRVNGVRYFACRPMHGIFSKLNTLTSHAINTSSWSDKSPIVSDISKPSDTVSDNIGSSVVESAHDGHPDCKEHMPANDQDVSPAAANIKRSSKMPTASSRPSGLARFSRSNASSSSSSLSQTVPASKSEANVTAGNTTDSVHVLKVGDRVVIGGNKEGTLRYFGATHFAKGEWAGIELDKPVGKNDGSVEGKR